MSLSPDQTPAVAYGLYSQEPIRTPGGGLIMPDLPPETLTRKAKLARLSESASWAEIVLLDWFKRIAVFGVSAAFDIERFERATQSLWRLTAVAKSIFALEGSPNKSIPAALQSEVEDLFKTSATLNSLGARTSTSATPLPASNPAPAQEKPSSLEPPTTPSADASSLGSRTASSAEAPASQTATPSPTTPSPTTPSPTTPTDTPTNTPTAISAPPTPHIHSSAGFQPASSSPSSPALPSPSVRAVPACPTISLDAVATYLNRTEADLAEATRPTPPIPPPIPPPTPDQSPSSPPSLPSLSPSPRSALATPHSSDPYAACDAACVTCAKPFCALRLVVPFSLPSSPLQCDGTCLDCPKCRTCEYTTPARLRTG